MGCDHRSIQHLIFAHFIVDALWGTVESGTMVDLLKGSTLNNNRLLLRHQARCLLWRALAQEKRASWPIELPT